MAAYSAYMVRELGDMPVLFKVIYQKATNKANAWC